LKRNLLLINVVLIAAACAMSWYVRKTWLEELAREQKLHSQPLARIPVPPPPALPKVTPLDAPSYADIAVKNLFSRDRNPTPIPDPPPPPPPPKPMPPLPYARGVMLWDGIPPTVVLSPPGRDEEKSYRAGDTIGEFKIVSVSNKEVVFEWDGKQIHKRLDELMAQNAPPPQGNSGAAASAAAESPNNPASSRLGSALSTAPSESLSKDVNGPGKEVNGVRLCQPGDQSPVGTVMQGWKKLVNQTPFGITCRWEPVK